MYVKTEPSRTTTHLPPIRCGRSARWMPNLPMTNVKTLEQQMEESLITERLIATLSSVFGVWRRCWRSSDFTA